MYHIFQLGLTGDSGSFLGASVVYATVHSRCMKYFFESALDGTSADSIALLSSSKYMVNTEQLQFECLGWWQLESSKDMLL